MGDWRTWFLFIGQIWMGREQTLYFLPLESGHQLGTSRTLNQKLTLSLTNPIMVHKNQWFVMPPTSDARPRTKTMILSTHSNSNTLVVTVPAVTVTLIRNTFHTW